MEYTLTAATATTLIFTLGILLGYWLAIRRMPTKVEIHFVKGESLTPVLPTPPKVVLPPPYQPTAKKPKKVEDVQ